MNKKLRYIYGFGGISLELAEIMSKNREDISGFVVDSQYLSDCIKHNQTNIPVISFETILNNHEENNSAITIALGEPFYREKLSSKLRTFGIEEASINLGEYVSSFSSIGSGTILHLGSLVSSNCSIGKSCLINKRTAIGHDSNVGDYTVISPSVTIGSHVSIGNNCFIGLGAYIRDRVRIGDNVIIGMGAVVTKNIESEAVAFGNPAVFVRRNNTHKVFKS